MFPILVFVIGLLVHFQFIIMFYKINSYYDIKKWCKSTKKLLKFTSSGFIAKSSTRNNTCYKKCNKKLAKKKPMIIMLMINRLIILGLLKCSVNDFLSLVCMFSSFP